MGPLSAGHTATDDRIAHAVINFVERHNLEQVASQLDWAASGIEAASSEFFVTEADLDEILMLLYRCKKRCIAHNSATTDSASVEEELQTKFIAFYREFLKGRARSQPHARH